ncbi:hypothetical protein WK13_34545 [Burkholderia ubonensis]|nr:hypothetical protein WK13_34545 [Burkholderia ubonensis]
MDSWPRRCEIRQATAFNETGSSLSGVDSYFTAISKETRETTDTIRIGFPGMVPGGRATANYASGRVFIGYPCAAMNFHVKVDPYP